MSNLELAILLFVVVAAILLATEPATPRRRLPSFRAVPRRERASGSAPRITGRNQWNRDDLARVFDINEGAAPFPPRDASSSHGIT